MPPGAAACYMTRAFLLALAGARSADADDGASVGDRLLSTLLTEMDGLQARLPS